jgi:hypothetical protein
MNRGGRSAARGPRRGEHVMRKTVFETIIGALVIAVADGG